MSIFSTLFSPIEKWRENPNRDESQPPTFNQQIQSIDRTEKAKIDGIEGITISAKTNIILSTNQSDEIVVRIHGMATTNFVLDAYVTQIENSIHIKAKEKLIVSEKKEQEIKEQEKKEGKGEEGVAGHSFVNITLEVEIPEKSNVKWIRIKNSNGDIICKGTINVDDLEVISKNGNIQVSSTFKKLTITSRTGNVTVRTTAFSNLNVEIENTDGLVSLNTENIGNVYMHYQLDGAGLINPKYSGEYSIYGRISIQNGTLIYS